MKHLSIFLSILILMSVSFPSNLQANISVNATESKTIPLTNTEVSQMLNRLREISTLDLSSMSKAEKSEIKKEIRTLNKAVRSSGNGGVYFSLGALIIIVLVLILVL